MLSGESYNRFGLPVEKERKIFVLLINHGKKPREFVSFIKLFVVTKKEIPKNTLERILRHSIRPGFMWNVLHGE